MEAPGIRLSARTAVPNLMKKVVLRLVDHGGKRSSEDDVRSIRASPLTDLFLLLSVAHSFKLEVPRVVVRSLLVAIVEYEEDSSDDGDKV